MIEKKPSFNVTEFVRNVIFGMADGLTVPFAIAAGLAGIHSSTTTIITAAMLSEIVAGSISMGLGGFLAAQTEAEHYSAEMARRSRDAEAPSAVESVVEKLREYGLTEEESRNVTDSIRKRKDDWVGFLMHFDAGLQEPDRLRALWSAVTIAGSYIVGGIIPLIPYIFIRSVDRALYISIIFTALALVIFGFLRGYFVGGKPWKSTFQTLLVGGIAAGVAYILGRVVF